MLLAIDPATKLGFCTEKVSGILNFSGKDKEFSGHKWLRFENWLREITSNHWITEIAVERVSGRMPAAVIHHSKLLGIIEKLCAEAGIKYFEYSAKEIKKFATGNGNADKFQMIYFAQQKYGYEGEDDNVADAIHLYHLHKSFSK